jgi:hypothetical protein
LPTTQRVSEVAELPLAAAAKLLSLGAAYPSTVLFSLMTTPPMILSMV